MVDLPAKDINAIFRTLSAQNPEPKTELEFVTPYTLLVAVVLSAQSTDKGVNNATRDLFRHVQTPHAMLALGEAGLKHHIRTIGLYNAKAKNIIALSQLLIERHNSIVPHDRAALEALPGVGRKTANVILNCAFGEPTMAVDTHVLRVSNRIGLAHSQNPLKVEEQLVKAIPKRWMQHAHHWLILHGRYSCKARKPECGTCSIYRWCRYPEKTA